MGDLLLDVCGAPVGSSPSYAVGRMQHCKGILEIRYLRATEACPEGGEGRGQLGMPAHGKGSGKRAGGSAGWPVESQPPKLVDGLVDCLLPPRLWLCQRVRRACVGARHGGSMLGP